MVIAGLVLAAIAALVHVFIFYLESIAWTSARARATFGTGTVEQASAQKELAFNQGFYNLFLAIVTGAGIVATATGANAVGAALLYAGLGSMLAAAVVLIAAARDKARAAVIQGTLPLIAIVLLVLGAAL